MSIKLVECAVYTPDFGDRIRILIEYAGAWRAIFWIELEKDGSIYFGLRRLGIKELRHATYTVKNGEQFDVRFSDCTEIKDPEVQKSTKFSFHASGIVNYPVGRASRTPLRSLKDQELLCSVMFQHPSQFDAISQDKVRKRDVCLRYPVDEQSPFYACLYAAPRERVVPVIQSSVSHQRTLMFQYPSKPEIAALTLQMLFCHGPQGPWPLYSGVIFETDGNDTTTSNRPQRPTL